MGTNKLYNQFMEWLKKNNSKEYFEKYSGKFEPEGETVIINELGLDDDEITFLNLKFATYLNLFPE